MLSGTTPSALAMAGTAVFKTVVSSDSMKKATATSQGSRRFADSPGDGGVVTTELELFEIILATTNQLTCPPFSCKHITDISIPNIMKPNDRNSKYLFLRLDYSLLFTIALLLPHRFPFDRTRKIESGKEKGFMPTNVRYITIVISMD